MEYPDFMEQQLKQRLEEVARRIQAGVRVEDPATCYVEQQVRLAPGCVILPNTVISGNTVIGEGCVLGPNTVIQDCVIGANTTVFSSVLTGATIADQVTIGPFSYLRPGSRIERRVKIGDFVEIKNSVLGEGTKVSHLTYIGDADVGKGCNFGCGTVVVNYDGQNKHRSKIGDHAFLGCNTNLVSPVEVGTRGYTAAGSTITEHVPEGALAIARAKQENKIGWVDRKGYLNK